MARPTKCRRISTIPGVTYFKPAGIPIRDLEEVCLSVEEIEAIRLKDLQGLEQEQGANSMQISRPTFQRILASAREKIADVLLNGKALRIDGGNFEIAPQRFRCANGHEWIIPYEAALKHPSLNCPDCGASEIVSVNPGSTVCKRHGGRRCCEQGQTDEIQELEIQDNNSSQIMKLK
jgi:predicted DNA-binding protein (UPF0251 family)